MNKAHLDIKPAIFILYSSARILISYHTQYLYLMGSYGNGNAASGTFVFFHVNLNLLNNRSPISAVVFRRILIVCNDNLYHILDHSYVPKMLILTVIPQGSYYAHSKEAEPEAKLGAVPCPWYH